MLIFIHVYAIIIPKGGIDMTNNNRPKIKDTKTRFNITIDKDKKAHLEAIADELGMSLNNLFIACAMLYTKDKFPYDKN